MPRSISVSNAALDPPRCAPCERVPRSFFARDTHAVARALLGKLLVRQWRGQKLVGRITEVESYVGPDDLACHAARGRTKRTEVMFGLAGHAYVYFIYGMYNMLNIVTEDEGFPAAVLIRALEPVEGIAAMQRARRGAGLRQIATGPGKLTQALHITRSLNGADLTRGARLWVASDGYRVPRDLLATGPRVGVDYAGEHAHLPWRYYLRDSHYVSKA